MLKEHPDWDVQKRAQELKPHLEAEVRKYLGEQGKKDKETQQLSEKHGVEPEAEMPAARINSILKKPENQDKAVMAYQANRKMGSIASTLGLPRNKVARGALRKFLRKKGMYKENGGWEKVGAVIGGFADKLLDKIKALEHHLQSTPISSRKDLGGGVNLTQIVIFGDGSKGVWKPHRGEKSGLRANVEEGFQTERETSAWNLAKVVGLDDLVTPCVEREFDGERGAVLEFQQGQTAHRVKERERRYDGDEDLKRMAVFDAVIANTDRHEGNWMVNKDGKLRLIDHGLAFPEYGDSSRNSALLEVRNRLRNRADDSPAAYFKPYMDKKNEIATTLTNGGLPEECVQGVLRRITKFSKATSWRDLNRMIIRREDNG